MIAAALWLALASAGAPPAEPEAALRQAMECRVYTEVALSVHRDDPRMLAADGKLHRYWMKRGDKLGKEMGLTPETLRIRQLVIPIEADRFRDVMLRCLREAPKGVLG